MPKKSKKPVKKTQITRPQIFWTLLILAAVLGIICVFKTFKHAPPLASVAMTALPKSTFDFGNQSYLIDDHDLAFSNGKYTSADSTVNGDIKTKTLSPSGNLAASIIAVNFGGSGTFYYLIGATKQSGKEVYSQPILLGDRISISSVTIEDPAAHDNGEIIVEYLDRPSTAPMSQGPTIKTAAKYAFQEDGDLINVLH